MPSFGIIIQARTGSTRLPKKMLLPFYGQDALIDVFLQNFKTIKNHYPVILATTNHTNDDVLIDYANKHDILSYRGSENNVLERFIETAKCYNIDVVVRVCADNPFLSIEYIENLIHHYKQKQCNYISYKNKFGIPTIKTHYGFFAELVELNTLIQINDLFPSHTYQEHVTNYIYDNSSNFTINLMDIPFAENEDVRLTIDTISDYNTTKEIYKYFIQSKKIITPSNVIDFLNQNLHYFNLMKEQILLQKK
jgi:spore coat polysaccharide biosynthesis protein SpsF